MKPGTQVWGTTVHTSTNTHTRLMALCLGLHRWAGTRKVKPIWIYWSKRQWVAVASAGLHASLHLAPDRKPRQCESTEGTRTKNWGNRSKVVPPNDTKTLFWFFCHRYNTAFRTLILRRFRPRMKQQTWIVFLEHAPVRNFRISA